MLNILILFLIGLYVFVHLIYILHFKFKPSKPKTLNYLVPVTIVVAVRNEEKNLSHFLKSLIQQDYPKELLEVIFGNDQSEDNSLNILKEYEKNYSWIKVVNIEKNIGDLKGKQNVLAQLIPLAKNENILVTDADIVLPTTWVSYMTAYLKNKTMISAPTIVEGNKLFHNLQGLDWLFSISVIKPFSDWGLPITAIGNNMGFKKSEYLKIGGYENLSFSLTEDYALFEKMILKNQGSFEWVHLPETLNISAPSQNIKTFLHQRKRWYEGAKKGPWYAILIFIHHILIYPALFSCFGIFNPLIAVILWIIKWLTDFLWLWTASSALKKQKFLRYFFLFQLYFLVLTILLPWYFWLNQKVEWKGRSYELIKKKI